MFFGALRGALSRRRWARALIQRTGALARRVWRRGTALTENNSNIAPGPGEPLLGQVSAPVLLEDRRNARPGKERADVPVACCGGGKARVIKAQRRAPGVEPRMVESLERVVHTRAAHGVAAPDHAPF